MRTSNPGTRGGSTEEAMSPNPFIDAELRRLRDDGFGAMALSRFGADLWRSARQSAAERPELRRELAAARWVGAAVSLLVGGLCLVAGAPAPPALATPLLWWLVLCAWVSVELGLVRHPISGEPSPRIGVANLMTLYRGWAAAPVLVLGLGVSGPTPIWVVLCIAAGITDLVDGTVAVRLRQESRLGRLLDPVLDSFFFSAAAVSLAHWRLLPGWIAIVVALRYFIPVVGGVALLFWRGRSLPVRHTPWGQRSSLLLGLAMFATWLSSLVSVPALFLASLYALALLAMLLALVGIGRRAAAPQTVGAP